MPFDFCIRERKTEKIRRVLKGNAKIDKAEICFLKEEGLDTNRKFGSLID
jgi:hypothetical protein